jgi:hypothetical protein
MWRAPFGRFSVERRHDSMCFEDTHLPFIYPLELQHISKDTQLLTVSMLLGKVTTKRNGEHISSRGLLYPIRQTIHDRKAEEGSHKFALHFAATPECNIALPDSYGSHRLAVLPGPQFGILSPKNKRRAAAGILIPAPHCSVWTAGI